MRELPKEDWQFMAVTADEATRTVRSATRIMVSMHEDRGYRVWLNVNTHPLWPRPHTRPTGITWSDIEEAHSKALIAAEKVTALNSTG